MSKKIVVGLSGGIDSSMALWLLKKQGWQPIGVTLRLPVWRGGNRFADNLCCAPRALETAQNICRQLKIPYYIINARKEFKKIVVGYFTDQLRHCRTPNPCVICNRYLKFDKLFEVADKLKIDYVASGHYARTKKDKNCVLLRAKDKKKDQSYYLSLLPQKWLKRLIFPVGEFTKREIYNLAKKKGLNYWRGRKQSQDFCYLGGQKLTKYITQTLKPKSGAIIETKGKLLGRHPGLLYYTLGQRKGIRLAGGPYFVRNFDIKKNHLIVTKDKNALYQKEINLSPFNFISGKIANKPGKAAAKIRYQQPLRQAVLYPKEGRLKIIFQKPILAATPGQICAFYKNDVCLGGGVIVK